MSSTVKYDLGETGWAEYAGRWHYLWNGVSLCGLLLHSEKTVMLPKPGSDCCFHCGFVVNQIGITVAQSRAANPSNPNPRAD